ncbi:MAG: hypothetical protein ACI9U2_004786 [Bradymonadia bacterium]|jgi:hypothetical protein
MLRLAVARVCGKMLRALPLVFARAPAQTQMTVGAATRSALSWFDQRDGALNWIAEVP